MVIVAALALYAQMRGDKPERIVAMVIVAGVLIDRIGHAFLDYGQFLRFSPLRLALDCLQGAGFFYVALRANRVWPIWIAAAQLVAIMGGLAPLAYSTGHRHAYWALTQLPIFVQLIALGIGTAAHSGRVRRYGTYSAWTPKVPQLDQLNEKHFQNG
ncbi:hypothetical protein GRF63_10965 [Erythrobacter sp. GH3-10]|uniref:Uncharacterized protein n=1 Tax=Aurantiacibacter rhizosphaerae TaxID=2691582 RepID=A0A844XFX5_9SPHN|nr:hypothetical protein [Aurantiacibacter rhizosphaerae]